MTGTNTLLGHYQKCSTILITLTCAYLDGHTDFVLDDVDEFSFAYRVSINDGQAQDDYGY